MYVFNQRNSPCFLAFPAVSEGKERGNNERFRVSIMQEGRLLLMKFRSFFSTLIFGFGCIFCFIGLIAVVLPSIHNSRLQLVLSGFEMPSEQPIVEIINRLMRFALAKNWYILIMGLFAAVLGALLYLHFTPKEKSLTEQEKNKVPASEERSVRFDSGEKPNPFAKATYQFPFMSEEKPCSFHPEPILERNSIDSTDISSTLVRELEPYFSDRFETETRAIESEIGPRSQSGSQILIRPLSEAVSETEYEPTETAVESKKVPKTNASLEASLHPVHAISPRIRSTMGRHTH